MRTIIQLSDFHIKQSFGEPEDNAVFQDLLQTLKQLDLGENTILVYNGDVIDQKAIRESVIAAAPVDFSAEWYAKMQGAYALAEKYFKQIKTVLRINQNNIIICCGNHDVFSCDTSDTALLHEINCPSGEVNPKPTFTQKRFALFADFCKRITGADNAEKTAFYKLQGFNFLVANSNWIEKRTADGASQKLCIDCQGILKIIEEHRTTLLQTKSQSKLQNIFVAHAPLGDYCEYGINSYPESKYDVSWPEVNRYFGLKLFGDKHTDTVNHYDYIVGAPLDWKEITFGIHQFDEDNYYHHKSIKLQDGQWSIIGSDEDIEKVFALSKPFLKQRAIDYLFGENGVIEPERKIANFQEARSGDSWTYLDKLLRSSADIQKPNNNRAGTPISSRDGFINTLTSIVSDSTKHASVIVKGERCLGKSVCMSLLYMNMLYRFFSGTFEFLPIYIDIEKALDLCIGNADSANRNSRAANKNFVKKIRSFFQESVQYAKRTNRSLCCLVDGLSQYYQYGNNKIEDEVFGIMESKDNKPFISHVVYCIDTGGNPSLGKVQQDIRKDAEYIVYFNSVLSKVGSKNKKAEVLIRSSLRLQGRTDEQAKAVIQNIKRLNILRVDPNLLVQFKDALIDQNCGSYFSLLDSFAETELSRVRMPAIARACYDYYIEGKTYQELHKQRITNGEFDVIRSQRNIVDYLLALNYVEALNRADYCPSALDRLYGHDICSLIREQIKLTRAEAKLIRFANFILDNPASTMISLRGISTLVFLLGRTDHNKEQIKSILDRFEELLCNYQGESSRFYKAVAKRSVLLSKVCVTENYAFLDSYIAKLISDDFERKVNRLFYLQFYGDRMDSVGETVNDDPIKEGFDVFNSFHIISRRIMDVEEVKNRYPLLELELFTLCDMIQMRVDAATAVSNSNISVPSFFYSAKFNKPKDDMAINVITLVVEEIKKYINLFGNANKNDMFIGYLQLCLSSFETILLKLRKGPLDAKDCFTPNSIMRKVMNLSTVKRVGWDIQNTPQNRLSPKEIAELQSGKVIESTQTHTFEAYLIGLLYLPNSSEENREYNKQTILNTLLIHDFGEVEVGDILPSFEDYEDRRSQEKLFCERLFLQSIHNNVSDLSECFALWKQWCAGESYNVKVAKEIDIIQRLFKMMCLIEQGQLSFSVGRIQEFWEDRKKIQTKEGRNLFDILIIDDLSFCSLAKKHGLNTSKLTLTH